MLAGTQHGLTERLLLARGFSAEMLSRLVLSELAIVVTEPMMARRGETLKVERTHITGAGREWLKVAAYGVGAPPFEVRVHLVFLLRFGAVRLRSAS
jgi:hypothetical protein